MCVCVAEGAGMQCTCAILSSVAGQLHGMFPHRLLNGTVFEKKVIEHKMCFGFHYNLSLKHLSL